MSRKALNWDAGPRIIPGSKFLRCRPPGCSGPEYFTIVSSKLRGLLVGTVGKRTRPVEDEADDTGIVRGSIRWEGYIHVKADAEFREECILRITAQAGVPLRMILDRGDTLRGLRVKFTRRGGARNGMLQIAFGSPLYSSEQLPAECDVQAYIDRMFNTPLLRVPLHDCPVDDRIASAM